MPIVKNIQTEEEMLGYFSDYVTHCKENPIYKIEYVGKEGREVKTPLTIPVTVEGFQSYLASKGILKDISDYVTNKEKRYSIFIDAMSFISNYCFVHNFNHAAVNQMNATLISRKLGMTDKIQNTNISLNVPNLPDIGNRE